VELVTTVLFFFVSQRTFASANLLQTCYGEASVMGFGLMSANRQYVCNTDETVLIWTDVKSKLENVFLVSA